MSQRDLASLTNPAAAFNQSVENAFKVAFDPEAMNASLAQYGLDARARSALQAFHRYCGSNNPRHLRMAALLQAVPAPAVTRDISDDYAAFIELLADLPARDLDAGWLDALVRAWLVLYASGCTADLPVQATRQLVVDAIALLHQNRKSYSALDADIALALANAGYFVCSVIAEATHGFDSSRYRQIELFDTETSLPNGRNLVRLIAECISDNPGGMTGLMVGRIGAGAAILTLEEDQWSRLHADAIARLSPSLRRTDVLCRTGRSEFAVILPGLQSRGQITLASNKLLATIDRPLILGGRPFGLTAHLGGAQAPDHGEDEGSLLRHARLAMHEAQRRRHHFALFEPSMQAEADVEANVEREFLMALDSDRLELHYQPQIDLATGRCTGAEALLRWKNDAGNYVPPPRIIDVAERAGALLRLTRWIIHRACRAASRLVHSGLALDLSINLTATDVGDPDLPIAVGHALDLWRVDATRLTFELTESAMLASQSDGAQVMRQLRKLGAATSIDDFGTGYSSVLYLRQLPLNEIKIDKVFVQQMAQSSQDREIVKSLIALAHGLKLEVVAEGVEDRATLELLRQGGCERVQGFLFSEALPFDDLLSWARNFSAR